MAGGCSSCACEACMSCWCWTTGHALSILLVLLAAGGWLLSGCAWPGNVRQAASCLIVPSVP